MSNIRKLFLILAVTTVVVMGAIFAIQSNQNKREYELIREAVRSESIAGKLQETKALKATECYPESSEKAVCKQIQYRIADGACTEILGTLQDKPSSSGICRSTQISRDYKNAQLLYLISHQDNATLLYVTHVSNR